MTGLHTSDINFIKNNYPDTFKVVWDLFDTDEKGAMDLVRKFMREYREGHIEEVV